jgi:hypothetical protein
MYVTTRFLRLCCGAALLCGATAFTTPAAAQSPAHVYVRDIAHTSAVRGPSSETSVVTDNEESRTLAGLVVDAATNKPLPSVHVTIDGTATNVRTNRDGRFYVRGVRPGTHTIEIRAVGYTPRTKNVRVAYGPSTSVDLWLNRVIAD